MGDFRRRRTAKSRDGAPTDRPLELSNRIICGEGLFSGPPYLLSTRMPESTIADFMGRFLPDSRGGGEEPSTGRIVLSPKRLVLASGDGQRTIPLADVFDVVVGQVPSDLSAYFDDTVAVAYRAHGERLTAIVEADAEDVSRFTDVLFRALLQGTSVRVKHPARVGGRYTDETAESASLRLGDRAVAFDGTDPLLRIDLSAVTHFEKTDRTINGRTRPALNVQYTSDGRSITAEVVMGSSRLMNLLGRYLRLEYADLLSSVRELDISSGELEVLVALYSAGDGVDLAGLVDRETSAITMLLNSLEEKGLVASTEEGTSLTSMGRLAVSEGVEGVNA